jgi:hypothetical protein
MRGNICGALMCIRDRKAVASTLNDAPKMCRPSVNVVNIVNVIHTTRICYGLDRIGCLFRLSLTSNAQVPALELPCRRSGSEEILVRRSRFALRELRSEPKKYVLFNDWGTDRGARCNGLGRSLRIGSCRIPEDTHSLLADLS